LQWSEGCNSADYAFYEVKRFGTLKMGRGGGSFGSEGQMFHVEQRDWHGLGWNAAVPARENPPPVQVWVAFGGWFLGKGDPLGESSGVRGLFRWTC